MDTFIENKNRNVLPNFRSLETTVHLGELNSFQGLHKRSLNKDITDYIQSFQDNRTVVYAGDLLGAALVNNITTKEEVVSAAQFILNNRKHSTNIVINIASKILGLEESNSPFNESTNINEFIQEGNLPFIHKRINKLKKKLFYSELNPFVYSELSRLYSIIGEKAQSEKNIRIAFHLAPHNRYILRSFARLLAHLEKVDEAHDRLRKNAATKSDPWLLASEIAFASKRNKSSNLIKFGYDIINSKKFDKFNISELASSIGTVELINGSKKKSKILFQDALVMPNDNSLAQAEWANNIAKFLVLDVNKYHVKNNYEACTLVTKKASQL